MAGPDDTKGEIEPVSTAADGTLAGNDKLSRGLSPHGGMCAGDH